MQLVREKIRSRFIKRGESGAEEIKIDYDKPIKLECFVKFEKKQVALSDVTNFSDLNKKTLFRFSKLKGQSYKIAPVEAPS